MGQAQAIGAALAIGLLMSLIKLLYAFSHLNIRIEDDPASNRTQLYLNGSATLIRLPQLASELESLRPGTEVHVHFEDLDYIDHACLDLLGNWERQHEVTGGSLVIEWDELSWRYHRRRPSLLGQERESGASASSAAATV